MQYVNAPSALRFTSWQLDIEGHTRGSGDTSVFAAGRGYKWRFRAEVAPMRTADALTVRAWLHSLRGRAGSTLLRMPGQVPAVSGPFSEDAVAALGAAAVVGATELSINSVNPAGKLVPGALIYFGDPATATGEMHRVVWAEGFDVGVEPPIRTARVFGEGLTLGRVIARWRLAGDTPAVPMINSRSTSFSLDLEEVT